jgi:hypothetical protein
MSADKRLEIDAWHCDGNYFKFLHRHETGLAFDKDTLQQIIRFLWHYKRIIILFCTAVFFTSFSLPPSTAPFFSLVASVFICYFLSLSFCPAHKKFDSLFPICCPYNITNGFRRARVSAKRAYLLRHVRPSVRLYQHGSHWTDLREI